MSAAIEETVPAGPEKGPGTGEKSKAPGGSSGSKKKAHKKKNQPGKYSQLVVDTIRKLGERSGSSLAKIYNEAKKVSWFDQQNGRTYLKYSVKALVQNDTLVQVKGIGANGSFKLNRKKLEGVSEKPAPAKKAAAAAAAAPAPKKSKAKAAKKEKVKAKKSPSKAKKKKKAAGGKKEKKGAKRSLLRSPKQRRY
ncbi:histone H1x-like [Rhinatrema bivittatum]|uniref:histone H1x-like n=1 Tax=Rhinatrema bivittatum TaxID=194408 RepID=UPI001126559F|nr:histone H1x-like [Rhinatrema bivittatum]